MRFYWTTIKVRDIEKSLQFYQEIVGLKVHSRFKVGPDQEIVFLGEGDTKVELIYNKELKEINIGQDISLGFEANNLEEKMNFITEKGINIHSGPFAPNDNVRFFYVLDPNGVKIQFVEQS